VIKEYFKPGDVLMDMFCGIGPMAIKSAKELSVKVLANDLNPDCYHYLRQNIVLNKCADTVIPFCMDA
jgi:tRNA (guanine37-N1)-methyltransferase